MSEARWIQKAVLRIRKAVKERGNSYSKTTLSLSLTSERRGKSLSGTLDETWPSGGVHFDLSAWRAAERTYGRIILDFGRNFKDLLVEPLPLPVHEASRLYNLLRICSPGSVQLFLARRGDQILVLGLQSDFVVDTLDGGSLHDLMEDLTCQAHSVLNRLQRNRGENFWAKDEAL